MWGTYSVSPMSWPTKLSVMSISQVTLPIYNFMMACSEKYYVWCWHKVYRVDREVGVKRKSESKNRERRGGWTETEIERKEEKWKTQRQKEPDSRSDNEAHFLPHSAFSEPSEVQCCAYSIAGVNHWLHIKLGNVSPLPPTVQKCLQGTG